MTIDKQESSVLDFRTYFLSLSLEQQVGIFVCCSLAGPELSSQEKFLLQTYKPLFVILFKRNFVTLEQSRTLISEIRALCQRPQSPFFVETIIAIDEEGGRVSRLPSPFPRGESAFSFAARNDLDGLRNQTLHQTIVAKALGINCLLAPVADILTEKNNPALGDRCFGETPEVVTTYALAVAQTLAHEGIFACAKHFPGHGNTTSDTHKEFATSSADVALLQQREWLPFQALISHHIPFIMTAHILLPALDQEHPATLSPLLLQTYLREKLGFKGLILSDDLRMNAIADYYKVKKELQSSITEGLDNPSDDKETDDAYLGHAVIDALKAGCDVVLSCLSIARERVLLEALQEKVQKEAAFLGYLTDKAYKIHEFLIDYKKI